MAEVDLTPDTAISLFFPYFGAALNDQVTGNLPMATLNASRYINM